ncbi:MAG TPA: hypothetical protein VHJ20_02060 [Polyangia bacterium]|nr:hypothetical protein [Polyangia bacterium]
MFAVVSIVAEGCGGGSHGGGGAGDGGTATGGTGGGAGHTGVGGSTGGAGGTTCMNPTVKKSTGAACICDGECTSSHCVDGVCCTTACTEACKTCSDKTSLGVCISRGAGDAPRTTDGCTKSDVSTCGFDGTCDGTGSCHRFAAGTQCSPGQCQGAAVIGARACDGNGLCKPGPAQICAPYSCDTTKNACFDSCTQNSQCATGQACANSSCGLKMNGASCMKGTECLSSFCADGVCCNVACGGGCVSCAQPDRRGTCWPTDVGQPDTRKVCKDTGASSCGTNGKCDGFGSCSKYPAETTCVPSSCTGTKRNTPGTCDGLGTCKPPGVQPCTPYLCVANAGAGECTTSCTTNAQCDTGHACVNGKCGPKLPGLACMTAAECASNHCVDGVCCDSECTGACKSCALASAPGKCTPVAKGNGDPRGVCVDDKVESCGTNGKCDGAGSCQKYPMGSVCAPESCTSNVYHPPSTCNSTGQCMSTDSIPCSPFTCNGTSCFRACTVNDNCIQPDNFCIMNSCGKKGQGAQCSSSDECQSNLSCAQGYCCDKPCAGACQSCALTGMLGTCTNVPTNTMDPAGLCADMGAGSCGTNGKCQAGACQKYPKDTVCKGSTCPMPGTTSTADSTCDGNGACVTPAATSCFPFVCGTNVCKNVCASNADCSAPATCIDGSCGLKSNGKPCGDGSECLSKFCAQGFCCNTACNGTCQSCALPTSLGLCSNVPDGKPDPQNTCKDNGQTSCDTDGVCNGKGGCQLYAAGTVCVAPSCASGAATLTQARTCDGVGNCQAAQTQACAPYKCNGMAACNAACTVDADCASGFTCDPKTNLCGTKKRLGQPCATTNDCLTGDFCVDSVCCSTSSCALCQACNVAPNAGTCTNIMPGNPDTQGRCAANPPCGNTGNCNGAGACEQASSSVSCGAASCTGSTFTPVSHCTGAGACASASTSSCTPYICGANACKTTCTIDADCMAPYTCQGSAGAKSCALKPNGQACTAGSMCISGNCVDGVCCGSASCPSCQACNLSGTGACSPVAAGTPAPASFCADEGAASCGNNGKCDGNGGCQNYGDGTSCSLATCPSGAGSLVMAGTCQAGVCSKPTQSCAPYFCNGVTACQTTCGSSTDCTTGYYCTGVGGTCVLKKAGGAACTADGQCSTGHCTDGVCCGSASCPGCQACNISGNGTCAPVSAGTDDGTCTDQGAATCGTNGKCDGAGNCQKYANGTTCSQATCASTATLKLAGACNGGTCVVGTMACSPYTCSAGACNNACNSDGDCASGTYCTGVGGVCAAKKANGAACNPAAPNQCAFGHCVDGVCCDTACTGSCVSCSTGTCTNVPVNQPDPRLGCADQGATSCGTNGLCDGNGSCQSYAPATQCSPAVCPTGMATKTLPGTCATGACMATTASCAPYKCGTGGNCAGSCAGDGDCVPGYYCNGTTCTATKDLGATCAKNSECTAGQCVENVCCGSAACPKCQSCAIPGSAGTCTNVGAGSSDPTNTCKDLGTMGCLTDGLCDGFGACEFYGGGTMCAAATCSGQSTATSDRFCDGHGGCGAGTAMDCGAYACNTANATCFKDTCADSSQCATGNVCDPTTTSCIPM